MRKVAIVARGGTNCLAPFRKPEWEIWGLPWISYPRVDRYFEVHSERFYSGTPDGWLKEGEWIARSQEKAPDAVVYCDPSRTHLFKNGIDYPIDGVMAALPFPYLENSIAYMIALAIHENKTGQKIEEIGVWGVHMFAGPESELAHASVLYLIGLAQGQGIKVTIPPGSPLFMSNYTAGRYGVTGGEDSMRPKIICFAGVTPYE